jgi:hypothetical protein
MTRRETLGLLCSLPLLGLSIRGLFNAKPAAVALQWDWDEGSGGPIDYFEVFVTSGETAAAEHNSVVTRVPGDVRASQVSLPDDGAHVYRLHVRAVNAQGSSDLSAPILLRA